jgi:hypothetical protein
MTTRITELPHATITTPVSLAGEPTYAHLAGILTRRAVELAVMFAFRDATDGDIPDFGWQLTEPVADERTARMAASEITAAYFRWRVEDGADGPDSDYADGEEANCLRELRAALNAQKRQMGGALFLPVPAPRTAAA